MINEFNHSPLQKLNSNIMTYIENPSELAKDEVFIKVEKKCQHSTPNSSGMTRSGKEETKKFVSEFFSSNGVEISQDQWQSPNEVTLSDCSSATLHNLTLEAERLGKTITYSRSLSIRISD